jgi:hypothetical protein
LILPFLILAISELPPPPAGPPPFGLATGYKWRQVVPTRLARDQKWVAYEVNGGFDLIEPARLHLANLGFARRQGSCAPVLTERFTFTRRSDKEIVTIVLQFDPGKERLLLAIGRRKNPDRMG